MFKQDAGRRAFNSCPTKAISYTNESRDSTMKPYRSYTVAIAHLACRGTGDRLSSNDDYTRREHALRDLAKIAGEAACKNCPLATLDEAGVNQYFAGVMASKAALLTAQNDVAEQELRGLQIADEIQARAQALENQAQTPQLPPAQPEA